MKRARFAQQREALDLARFTCCATVHEKTGGSDADGETHPHPLNLSREGFSFSKRSAQGLGIVTRRAETKLNYRFGSVSVANRARYEVRPIHISFLLNRAITKLINQSSRGL